jgi:hypothetical protein
MGLVYRNGRPYLYQSVRRGGRVTSEYRGSGPTALLIGRIEAGERQQAVDCEEDWKAERERMETEEQAVAEMFDRIATLAEAALVVAGFHRHRGRWRKHRG